MLVGETYNNSWYDLLIAVFKNKEGACYFKNITYTGNPIKMLQVQIYIMVLDHWKDIFNNGDAFSCASKTMQFDIVALILIGNSR